MTLNLWKNIAVKEQRVGGSCSINLMLLRCTLTGFERNFQVRTLSTRISIQRYYTHKAVQQSLSENQNVLQLDPLFITGINTPFSLHFLAT